jgi:hypothetical protein
VSRPGAILLVGLWLGMLFASWVMATVNFRTAERVVGPSASPEMTARLGALPTEERRAVMRHLASELNRWMFATWALAQTLFGVLLLVFVWRLGTALRVMAAVVLLLSAAQALGLVPAIRDLGRTLDFLPRPLPPALAGRFGRLHAGYVGIDLLKAGLLAFLSVRLFRPAPPAPA